MSEQFNITELYELIKKNSMKSAVDYVCDNVPEDFLNQTVILQRRYNSYCRRLRMNDVSAEEFENLMDEIALTLLNLVNKINQNINNNEQ